MTRAQRLSAAVISGGAVVVGALAYRRRPRAGSERRLLSDRTARTAELVRLGSRAGTGLAAHTVRGAFAGEERKAELRAQFEMQTAAQVVESLGNMKGAVMKIGQMASYLDQGLPEPVRQALAQLQTEAPPMSAGLAAGVIRAELGGPPLEVFAEWDERPLAAASIGQVHRAVTHEGRRVAVKVQYPGVDDAIRADLDNSDLLFGALGMLFPGMDPKPIAGELRDRLVEELDYRQEAANQVLFVDAFEGHPTIHVPEVLLELSSDRVLTTELADGATFAEVRRWSQDERNLAAETIFRYAFDGIYDLGVFNGDPHPGNYLFSPGGHVTFLDYGLTKAFTRSEVSWFERLITAMCITHDIDEFVRLSVEVGVLSNPERFTHEQLEGYFSHFYEPVLRDVELTITPEYASESVRRYFDLSSPYAEVMKAANLPPAMVIVQRINLGLFAVLAELGATANWRRIAEEIWPWVAGAPSTPMGSDIARWKAARTSGTAGATAAT